MAPVVSRDVLIAIDRDVTLQNIAVFARGRAELAVTGSAAFNDQYYCW
ncbi:MAG: hypothetical protein AAB544_02915 [Patescibacteria group bacterium]